MGNNLVFVPSILMKCKHEMKLHYDGFCTIIVGEKRNKPPMKLHGHFVVNKCVHCNYLKGRAHQKENLKLKVEKR